jgi:hypothetical protein
VFSLLTKYLVQYGRLCIPHVGTFEIERQPPRLDIGDKMLAPPLYKMVFSEGDHLSEHQLDFIRSGTAITRNELASFGEKLKHKIRQEPVHLTGFGVLRYSSNSLVFEPHAVQLPSLQPLPAQKVIRENVQHQMLVGDREMSSQQVTDVLNQGSGKRSLLMIVGWAVFILAVLLIIFLLYLNSFQTAASGTRFPL